MMYRIEQECSGNTTILKLFSPMKFARNVRGGPVPEGDEFTAVHESDLVAVHTCDLAGAHKSTVIHAARKLQGGEGYGYGADGHRIVDGIASLEDAMRLQGYVPEGR